MIILLCIDVAGLSRTPQGSAFSHSFGSTFLGRAKRSLERREKREHRPERRSLASRSCLPEWGRPEAWRDSRMRLRLILLLASGLLKT